MHDIDIQQYAYSLTMFGSAFVLLTLGIIITFVRVPYKEQYQRVRRIGIGLVVCYLTLSVFSLLNASTGYTEDMDYISLVVASVQAAALTWVMVALINPDRLSWRFVCWQTLFAALIAAAVACICVPARPLIYVRVGAGILYLFQCYLCMLTFRRAYRTAVSRLEAAYDDWVRYRLRWARWGFYCGVLVGVIAYLVIGFGEAPSIVFVVAYMAYYVMLTIVYIDYVYNLRFYEPILAEPHQQADLPQSKQDDEAEECGIVSHDLPCPEKEPEDLSEETTQVRQALDAWIEHKGFCSESTIADIAETMNVSVYILRKYVKSTYGEDFRTWRIQLRVAEACRLLIERRDMPINQVGEEVGIPNKGNFTNYFSRITGMTPKQYRAATPE
ncbi:MAG: AraC family transcriptional regulator [Muribaculaceae bacterium]|nr:AraC family transcriptional regulator [Muribaculaceae bacterium]